MVDFEVDWEDHITWKNKVASTSQTRSISNMTRKREEGKANERLHAKFFEREDDFFNPLQICCYRSDKTTLV